MGGVEFSLNQIAFPLVVFILFRSEYDLHVFVFGVVDYSDEVNSGVIEFDFDIVGFFRLFVTHSSYSLTIKIIQFDSEFLFYFISFNSYSLNLTNF